MSCLVTIWSWRTSDQITDLKFSISEWHVHSPICLVLYFFFWGGSYDVYHRLLIFKIRNNSGILPQGNCQDHLTEMTEIDMQLQSPLVTKEWVTEALSGGRCPGLDLVSHTPLCHFPALWLGASRLICTCASISLHINWEYENLSFEHCHEV